MQESEKERERGEQENVALLGCSIKKSHLLTYKSCVQQQQRVPKRDEKKAMKILCKKIIYKIAINIERR